MKKNGGFTILEIVVVATIVAFISGLILFNSPKFNLSMKMNSAARQLSFAFRDAEARSTAVRQFEADFPENYGVHVNKGGGYLVIFSDGKVAANNKYDGDGSCSPSSECVKLIRFEGGIHISSIHDPNKTPPFDAISGLSVIFRRPYPAVYMYNVNDPPDCLGGPTGCMLANGPFRIVLSGPSGSSINDKVIEVWTTGQVSIK